MTTQLENSAPPLSNPATTLPRFPAKKVGPSLLSRIQSAVDGVIIIDARRRIVLVNARAEQLFGYSAAQLLDQPLETVVPSHGDTHTSTPGAGNRSVIPLRGIRPDGKTFDLAASIARVSIQGETFLVLIVPGRVAAWQSEHNRRPVVPPDVRRWAATSQQAAEIEKRRFSRKLYDEIGQRLSVLKLDLDWLENSLPNGISTVPDRVARMQGLLDNVIAMTKNMASTLRPPLLDDFGLLPAVEWMAENLRKRTGISCTIESIGMEAKLDDTIQSAVFRLVQEGLSNVERHSRARTVKILLQRHPGHLSLMIQDDGVGMADGSENKPGCFGLIAMQERVFVLGGTIAVRNAPPYGVTIQASIPTEPFFSPEQPIT